MMLNGWPLNFLSASWGSTRRSRRVWHFSSASSSRAKLCDLWRVTESTTHLVTSWHALALTRCSANVSPANMSAVTGMKPDSRLRQSAVKHVANRHAKSGKLLSVSGRDALPHRRQTDNTYTGLFIRHARPLPPQSSWRRVKVTRYDALPRARCTVGTVGIHQGCLTSHASNLQVVM